MTREKALELAIQACEETWNEKTCKQIRDALEQEPKIGHWKPYLKEGLTNMCSECGSRFDRPWDYCPHCGARMDGDAE